MPIFSLMDPHFEIQRDYFSFNTLEASEKEKQKKKIDFSEMDSLSSQQYNPTLFSMFSDDCAVECILENSYSHQYITLVFIGYKEKDIYD